MLEHCHHIIPETYKQQGVSHIDQAITLTLTEIECREIPSPLLNNNINNNIDKNNNNNINNHPTPNSKDKYNALLRLSLPRILHNANLASSVASAATKGHTQFGISWHASSSQHSEILRAYYLVRHIVLASDHPHLRSAVEATLTSLSPQQHDANIWLDFFFTSQLPSTCDLAGDHGMYVFKENVARSRIGRNHYQWENEWLLLGGWRAVEDVVGEARWNEREGRGGEAPSWEFEEDLLMGL